MAYITHLFISFIICAIFSIVVLKEFTLIEIFTASLIMPFVWAAIKWVRTAILLVLRMRFPTIFAKVSDYVAKFSNHVAKVSNHVVNYVPPTYLTPKQICENEAKAIISTGFTASHEHIMMNSKCQNVRFIAVDESNLKIMVGGFYMSNEYDSRRIFSIDDVLGVRVSEDGKVTTDVGNTLGMAAIGGLMFGGTGAIVGAISGKAITNKISNISLVIAIDNLTTPIITLVFLTHEADKNTVEYKEAYSEAHKWAAIINILISRREKLRIATETQRNEKLLP